jgi:hypothetical protein
MAVTLYRGDRYVKNLTRGTGTFDADSRIEMHTVDGQPVNISYTDFIAALSEIYLVAGDTSLYYGTSVNNMSIGGGTKTFDTQAGLAYIVGQRVRLTYNANNFMSGAITSYTGTVMEVEIDFKRGSGSYNSWVLSPTDDQVVPDGGTSGQVLGKSSSSSYDVAWVNMSVGGSSGNIVIRCGDRVSGGTSAIIRLGNRV